MANKEGLVVFIVITAVGRIIADQTVEDQCAAKGIEKYINTTNSQFTATFCPWNVKNETHKLVYECFNTAYRNCTAKSQILDCIKVGSAIILNCIDPPKVGTYEPVISGIQSSFPVMESSRLKIDCSSYTNHSAEIDYTWTFEEYVVSNGSELDIKNIKRNQAGNYTCTCIFMLTKAWGSQKQATFSVVVDGIETKSSLTPGGIAGIVIAVITVIAIVIGVIFGVKKCRRGYKRSPGDDPCE